MGERMEPGDHGLLPKVDKRGEGLVDHEETSKQRIPGTPGKRYGMNWTEILARENLESPGYHETVSKMRSAGRIKGY
jgi:hypothetical protein